MRTNSRNRNTCGAHRSPGETLLGVSWLALSLACTGAVTAETAARTPRFQLFERGTWVATPTVGALEPLEGNRDVRIADARLGVAYYFRDRLAVVGEGHLDSLTGRVTTPGTGLSTDVSAAGGGGALLLRWHFAGLGRWSAFVDGGWGFLVTDDDFPPGGTAVNGTRQLGLGWTMQTSEDSGLVAGLRQVHVSNGRGLVDDNPSYDGVGAYVGGFFSFGSPTATEGRPVNRTLAPTSALRSWFRLEAVAGDIDGNRLYGVAADWDGSFGEGWRWQATVASSDIEGEALNLLGLAVYRRSERGLRALWADRQELGVFSSDRVAFQVERHVADVATVVGLAGWERRSHDVDRLMAAARVRLHAGDYLLVEPGLSIVEPSSRIEADDIELSLNLEYAPPRLRQAGISLFVVDRVDETIVAGLRWAPRSESLRRRHRDQGLHRVRF